MNNDNNNNNNENIEQETQNKSWWKKLMDLKQNYILKIVLLIFIVSILTCGCKTQTKASSNTVQKNKEPEITIKNINPEKMKISTPEECKEKGLHYIGEMNVPRVFHKTIKLNDGNILIVGGYNKITPRNIRYEGDNYNNIEFITTQTAEIFNIKNYSFKQIPFTLSENDITYLLIKEDGNIVLISDKSYQNFNIKNNEFETPKTKNILKKIGFQSIHSVYSYKEKGDIFFECSDYINSKNYNYCWSTNLNDFTLESFNNIKLYIPEYLKPLTLGYIKLNNEEILIYTKSFPRTNAQNIYLSIYNIKNNKIVKTNELENVGNYSISQPILIEDNRVLFTGGVSYERTSYKKYRKLPWFIYNAKQNKIEETLDMLFPDSITSQDAIKINNEKILIIENNKIRQFFNTKKNRLEYFDGFELENLINPNIIQISENQLLITGGKKNQKELNNSISKKAWIYTF